MESLASAKAIPRLTADPVLTVRFQQTTKSYAGTIEKIFADEHVLLCMPRGEVVAPERTSWGQITGRR